MTHPIDLRSDNCGGVAPEFLEALARANQGTALGYGADDLTASLNTRFSDLFEKQVRVFPVATGTAANAISLAATCSPFGAVYCSPEAHVITAECNATGFFGSGLKLTPVAGQHGKLDAGALADTIATAGKGLAHRSQPAAVNIVQATDMGAVYELDEVAAIGAIAHDHDLTLHMDGARFANAVARLGCTPAQATWRSGVDVLSFGVTKNGGLLADAIVVFNPDIAQQIGFHLRRAGLVWSKMRFASAQVLAAIEDDLWLQLATQSNAAAARLASGLQTQARLSLLAPVQANEVFVQAEQAILDSVSAQGILYYRRSPTLGRFVCRWDSTADEIDTVINAFQAAIR